MPFRKITQIGHPVLRQKARPLTREELLAPATQQLIDDMIDTMRDAQGAGLAAIQVYEPVRIAVVEVTQNARYPYKPPIPLTILVNPELTPIEDERFDNYEGCLSVPRLTGYVRRYRSVRVDGFDEHGEPRTWTFTGWPARIAQHEIDHLNGVLYLDRVETRSLSTVENYANLWSDQSLDQIASTLGLDPTK